VIVGNALRMRGVFEFFIPRRIGASSPIGFSVPLRNSTVIGAEDHAEVVFSLSNIIAEKE
jgi:hypothetical protein